MLTRPFLIFFNLAFGLLLACFAIIIFCDTSGITSGLAVLRVILKSQTLAEFGVILLTTAIPMLISYVLLLLEKPLSCIYLIASACLFFIVTIWLLSVLQIAVISGFFIFFSILSLVFSANFYITKQSGII
ncbi:MAG: hypothetical protein RR177_06465 [Oscillospiraceae bacterium]